MINEEKEQTIWKTYPEYPFIEANQFGEIRTKDRIITCRDGRKRFVKGRVLKQYLHKNGYLHVHFSVNGKTVNLMVHRIVASCFLQNPDNLPEVNHIDNDPTNNSVSNLEWCTRQYNEAYKKNFGTSQAQVQGLPVFAVNLKTSKVLRFETRAKASQQLGINESCICWVINGKIKTSGDYWFTENENEITKKKIQKIKANMYSHKLLSHPVIAVKLDTFEVSWFESQSEAARQLGVSAGNVCSVLKGKLSKTKDCWFTHANENAIEETRKKFGNEITKKVEKLIREYL